MNKVLTEKFSALPGVAKKIFNYREHSCHREAMKHWIIENRIYVRGITENHTGEVITVYYKEGE